MVPAGIRRRNACRRSKARFLDEVGLQAELRQDEPDEARVDGREDGGTGSPCSVFKALIGGEAQGLRPARGSALRPPVETRHAQPTSPRIPPNRPTRPSGAGCRHGHDLARRTPFWASWKASPSSCRCRRTGHLLLAERCLGLGFSDDRFDKTFAVLIQLGSVLALLGVYTRKLLQVAVALPRDRPQGPQLCRRRSAGIPAGPSSAPWRTASSRACCSTRWWSASR